MNDVELLDRRIMRHLTVLAYRELDKMSYRQIGKMFRKSHSWARHNTWQARLFLLRTANRVGKESFNVFVQPKDFPLGKVDQQPHTVGNQRERVD